MTPKAFVTLVRPHFPIGPYDAIEVGHDNGTESILMREDNYWSDNHPENAAHMLLGAIIEEAVRCDENAVCFVTESEVSIGYGCDGSGISDACGRRPNIFELLEGMLRARKAYRTRGGAS